MILGSEPQLTLAVYGEWGVGKTTLLRAIVERLSEFEQCAVAWFDMWEYKNNKQVLTQLLEAIASAVPQHTELSRELRKLSRVALASASFSSGSVTFSGKDLLSEVDKIVAAPKIDRKELSRLVGRWRNEDPHKRIVVIVDNLDRCLPNESAGLLEQISSLFGFSGIMFLLAAEPERLSSAVELANELHSGEGQLYLEKIVQVEFRVPIVPPDHLVRWVQITRQGTNDA